jgi:hypothetical protein
LELGKRLSRGLLPCKQSSLPTHISATVTASLCVRMKKLTAFVELESVIRAASFKKARTLPI